MKLLLADDHDLVRDTLCAYLAGEPDFQIVSASDFDAAAEIITREGPFDIVLLDYEMPGMNGLEGLARARELNFNNPVAILSGSASRQVAEDALASGAAGFLPKSMAARSLIHAIRFMAAGEQYAPIAFMTEKEEADAHPLAARLTPREREVLQGLAQGKSNKEIARDLALQEVTIKLHVKTLCRKLEARNRTQAAMIAKEAGLF
ncbi:response regulator [Acuticoccus yangtzensis]|uniref:response regulator n=1 Tax=Acuticoccus yangtzensis TaxID=1443441 RepID=UPI000949A41A|nr:response regulator transcription factor [Acuticoccus yangtzensis]